MNPRDRKLEDACIASLRTLAANNDVRHRGIVREVSPGGRVQFSFVDIETGRRAGVQYQSTEARYSTLGSWPADVKVPLRDLTHRSKPLNVVALRR